MSHVESQVQRKALLAISGENDVISYLDSLGHAAGVYEVNGTSYSLTGSTLRSHDFTDFTKVTKIGDEQRMLYNLSASGFADLFDSTPDLNMAVIVPNVYELSAVVSSLSTIDDEIRPFSVILARDCFHKYLCKLYSYYFLVNFLF